MLKRLGIVLGLLLAFSTQAFPQAQIIATCGTVPAAAATLVAGGQSGYWMNTNGQLCVNATVSASVSGFHTESSLTPITATTGAGGVSSSAFTAGKSVLVSNTGATNTAFCAPGATATTSSTPILPGQTVEITTTAETAITCITSASTTTVSFQVGTGLATGWGGSGSGGGGGAITAAASSYSNGAYPALETAIASTNTKLDTLHTDATSAIVGGTNLIGYTSADPCEQQLKTNVAISQAANTKLISATSAKKNYICSIVLIAPDAEKISVIEGSGSTCGTSGSALIGSTTVASGMSLAANGGLTYGNGKGTVAGGVNTNYDVCLLQSGTGYVAGNITYVQQ